jgi:aryl-alcohol dehydrogenase-like predicted oxidoreductase
MEKTILGRTDLKVTRTSFGALPIQRVEMKKAVQILRKAYESGINFFDTARAYSNSEEKIGKAFKGVRKKIIIATKTGAQDKTTLFQHLEKSLKMLQTDYIDIFQLHNIGFLPDPDDPDSLYSGLVEAKKKGVIRFFGMTNHRIHLALQAVHSELYDTMQFPLSYISALKDIEIINACKQHNIGLIAMKALCGGLIKNIPGAFAFLRQYKNVVPIWGIQKLEELKQIIALDKKPPVLDEIMRHEIEQDKKELGGNFCRGCGYCMPCKVEIPINLAARMKYFLRRSPWQPFMEDTWKNEMLKIQKCTGCGKCKAKCPYGLDTPKLLKYMLNDYMEFYKEKTGRRI